MKLTFFLVLLTLVFVVESAYAQVPKPAIGRTRSAAVQKTGEVGQAAVVIDETLSVLRVKPSLFSESVQRMRRGRKIQILEVAEADGVKFFRVTVPPASFGWVQADAVFGKFRPDDEERLARFVQASDGFDQIEIAIEFLQLYPTSKFRPQILLLYGDLLEVVAAKLSTDATKKLSRKEMAATAAPLHSYYLNYVSLDRYRKLGVTFLFNSATKQFHYDGSSWKEIAAKFAGTPEQLEAKKRLETLRSRMDTTAAK
jgi:hypothetical protein